jgi:predicted RNA-binding Zn-ribbon protein involved in translation (DUF1610 family)
VTAFVVQSLQDHGNHGGRDPRTEIWALVLAHKETQDSVRIDDELAHDLPPLSIFGPLQNSDTAAAFRVTCLSCDDTIQILEDRCHFNCPHCQPGDGVRQSMFKTGTVYDLEIVFLK